MHGLIALVCFTFHLLFFSKPAPYAILEPELSSKRHTYIQVSGLPRIRAIRAPNWGWVLVNHSLILESIQHLPQPAIINSFPFFHSNIGVVVQNHNTTTTTEEETSLFY
mmetsp:Transcript_26022/g.32772  ORF Transcript_26022/g.32772 Transcript_26022/m.32772 type:complete len:109 (+) Transcript_26022:452-778(+)